MDAYVTQREFARMEHTVNEMYGDLKTVVAYVNREKGAEEERHELLSATRDKGARRIAWSSLAAAGIGGLWWVQDAVAHIMRSH